MEYPKKITPELREVLGLMNFQTCPVAHALRAAGEDIPHKTEAEQAHVLHWMIGLALEHGPAWREKVGERLKEIASTQST
jgi:2-methylcitrate dehydratase PrpD